MQPAMHSDMIWNSYLEGLVTPREVLRALVADLSGVLTRKSGVEQDESTQRERISLALARLDEPESIHIDGFTLELRGPSIRQSYSTKALDALAQHLADTGQEDIAAQIRACRTPQAVAGSLVITTSKATKARIAAAARATILLPDLATERAERLIDLDLDLDDGTLVLPDALREERATLI